MQIKLIGLGLASAAALSAAAMTSVTPTDWTFTDIQDLKTRLAPPSDNASRAATRSATANTVASAILRHDIAVTTVDADAIQDPNKHTGVPNLHQVLVPSDAAARVKKLFLFVNGTNQSETSSQEILQIGPWRGYHTISIAYPNYDAVAVTCAGSLDADCTGKVREEVLTGEDLSPLVTIRPSDALEPRLRKLLVHLKDAYPNEGWGSFLKQGQVDWELVSAAGHSQGSGHVGLLAKRHRLQRAVIISGIADVTASGQPAAWLYRPNATPIENIYGFTHVADYVVPLALAHASWRAIGIDWFGPDQSVDGRQPTYGGSHMLTTAKVPAAGVNPHLAMMDDDKLPRNSDGSVTYRPVWEFMILP